MNNLDLKLLSLDELEKLRDKLLFEINRHDIRQYTFKIALNSMYGCMTSKQSPLGDDRLGNACTLSGQASIKEVNRFVKEYIQEKYCPDLTEQEKEAIIQFNDTDSCGITLQALSNRGIIITENGEVTKKGFEIINDIANAVNKRVSEYAKEHFNTDNCSLDLKLEKICDAGIYRKKKNYALHVIYDEGKIDEITGKYKTKWHYSGIELAKAIMSKELKELGKEIIEPMILRQNRAETDERFRDAYSKFKKLPLITICRLARINGTFKEYTDKRTVLLKDAFLRLKERNISKNKTFEEYCYDANNVAVVATRTPQHIKAACYYNSVLKSEGLTKYQPISIGDTCQILKVTTNNKYNIDTIALRDGEMPKEFEEIFEPDYFELFQIPFYACISSLYKVVGWEIPNLKDDYAGNLFDIFG